MAMFVGGGLLLACGWGLAALGHSTLGSAIALLGLAAVLAGLYEKMR